MPNKVLKKKLILKQKIKQKMSKLLIIIIIFLIGMITIKTNPKYKLIVQKNIFEKSLDFTKAKNLYQKYFGKFISIENLIYEEKPVFNEEIFFQEKKDYKDGVALTVATNYMVPCIDNGIVVYIGNKKDYGQTIIIEQENGIDVFYSNVVSDNIKLYDYIEKGEYVGQVKTNKLYLLFQKDGVTLDYKDYI